MTNIRKKTLYFIKPEIFQALETLLNELKNSEMSEKCADKYPTPITTQLKKNKNFFFHQNGLHVLLTRQFDKINCEIIKIKIHREKAFNKTMTKHMQNLSNIFWMLRQW